MSMAKKKNTKKTAKKKTAKKKAAAGTTKKQIAELRKLLNEEETADAGCNSILALEDPAVIDAMLEDSKADAKGRLQTNHLWPY